MADSTRAHTGAKSRELKKELVQALAIWAADSIRESISSEITPELHPGELRKRQKKPRFPEMSILTNPRKESLLQWQFRCWSCWEHPFMSERLEVPRMLQDVIDERVAAANPLMGA